VLTEGGHGVKGRRAFVRVRCPKAQPDAVQDCDGKVWERGDEKAGRSYLIPSGESARIGFKLDRSTLRRLGRKGKITLRVKARNRDSLGGSSLARSLVFRDRR
jgi:hypothetical protein